MSETQQQLQTEPETAPEVRLEPEMEAAFEQEFETTPVPVGNEMNQRVLGVLASGRELTTWQEQTLLRLKWMALPVLAGFVLLSGIMAGFTHFTQAQLPAIVPANTAVPSLPPFAPLPEPFPKGTTYRKFAKSSSQPILWKEKKK